jgi:hypothetical protein
VFVGPWSVAQQQIAVTARSRENMLPNGRKE